MTCWGISFGTVPTGNDNMAVSCGYRHCCVIKSNGGGISCFGDDTGNGNLNAPAVNDAVAICSGGHWNCVLTSTGTLN